MQLEISLTSGIIFLVVITAITTGISILLYTQLKYKSKAIALEIPAGILTINIQGDIVYSNPHIQKSLGISADEMHNINFNDMVDKTTKMNFLEFATGSSQSGSIRLEGNFLSAKGRSKIPLDLTIKKSIDPKFGEVYYILALDAKERIESRQKIMDSEIRFRKIFEQLPVGLFRINTHGNILMANPAMASIFHSESLEYFVQTNFASYFYKDSELVFDEFVNKIIDQEGHSNFELSLITNQTNTIKVKVNANAIRNNTSEILYLEGTLEDITLESEARLESELQRNKFEGLFFNSPLAIVMLNDQGIVANVNRSFEKLFQFDSQELIGKSLSDFIIPNGEPDIVASSDKPNEAVFELKRIRKDGQLVDVTLYAFPIRVDNKFFGVFGLYVDHTELKAAENEMKIAKERAIEMNSLKSNFLANMSHELRTPMNGILGYSTLLLEDESIAEEAHKMVSRIQHSSNRLMDTLNLILELSQLESNKTDIIFQNTDLAWITIEESRRFEATAKEKSLEFSVFEYTKPVPVCIDEKMTRKIIYHLIDNATKFTRTGGIRIEVITDDLIKRGWAIFRVTDTGIGIEEKHQAIIFDEFRQASEGMGRSYEGSGLGLTLSKKFVELMHGKISVTSKPGEGSTFDVMFPLMREVELPYGSLDESLSFNNYEHTIRKLTLEQKPKLLIVEDDEINREVVIHYFQEFCDIEYTTNGVEAISKILETEYDVVLMDINLGMGINGLEVVKKIRAHQSRINLPIIATTAYAFESDRKKCIESGCTEYISKPFTRKEVISLVNKVLSSPNS